MRFRLRRVFRFKKSFITILVIALATGLTILIVKSLEAPAVGSISQTPASEAEFIDPLAKPGKFSGKYVRFSYPAHYQTTPAALSGSNLEVASYHFVGQVGRQINISVYKNSLDTDGSVDLRKKHPEIYKQTSSSLGIEFTKIDGSEDTFFLTHNDMLAVVSVLGPAATNGDAVFIASSLRWQ